MAISQEDLNNKASSYTDAKHEYKRKCTELYQTKAAFLSHSHKDQTLVKGLIVMFQEQGIELYIDWQDTTMPEKPNVETANKIQKQIIAHEVFLFLATENSTASRWCPWEIGYADSCKRRIYIIPTKTYLHTYGNEYLDLYSKIDMGSDDNKSGLGLFKAGRNEGEWLSVNNI